MRYAGRYILPLLLFALISETGNAQGWRLEVERSLADEWQTSVRLGGTMAETRNSWLGIAAGITVTPEPGDWEADGAGPFAAVEDAPVTFADPLFASGLWCATELRFPLGITLSAEPRLFMEWSHWTRSPGYVPEEMAIWSEGSGWALVGGLMGTVRLRFPFHLTAGVELGIEKDIHHENLANGRDTVIRSGFSFGYHF